MSIHQQDQVTALILAGGQGRRLGGVDKGRFHFQDKTLVEHVIESIRPQVSGIVINANRSLESYRQHGYPVISDQLTGFQGPLAGFAAGLSVIDTPYMVTMPCDGPWLPDDLVYRLINALHQQKAELAVAHDGQRLQPVYCLLSSSLLSSLEIFLAEGGRKIDQWYARHNMALADFSDNPLGFSNINTLQDQQKMEQQEYSA